MQDNISVLHFLNLNLCFCCKCLLLCCRLSVTIPSVSSNALGYGAFLGLYANLRYQLLFGFDRAVTSYFDVIGVALFFSTALRFVLSVYLVWDYRMTSNVCFLYIYLSTGHFFLLYMCFVLDNPLLRISLQEFWASSILIS